MRAQKCSSRLKHRVKGLPKLDPAQFANSRPRLRMVIDGHEISWNQHMVVYPLEGFLHSFRSSMSQARSGGRVVGSGAGWTDGPFKREIEC